MHKDKCSMCNTKRFGMDCPHYFIVLLLLNIAKQIKLINVGSLLRYRCKSIEQVLAFCRGQYYNILKSLPCLSFKKHPPYCYKQQYTLDTRN